MWDKWTQLQAGMAARSLLMPLVLCVGWPGCFGPDGECMSAWFFPVGGIKVGGRCAGRAELVPQHQPHTAASSSSPTSSCGVQGCGHREMASSVSPSNRLFLESLGRELQTKILLPCIFPRSTAPPGVMPCRERAGGGTGGSAAGLWAGSAWLPPSPPWAPGP